MNIFKSITNSTSLTSGLFSLAIAASLLLASGTANAASQCKGLENSACSQNTSCGWVQGYERKDGRKVSGFCRTKAKSKSQKKTTTRN